MTERRTARRYDLSLPVIIRVPAERLPDLLPHVSVKRIVDWFCEGSVEALLVGMVDSKVLDRAELQRLAARIAEAQKQATKTNKEADK